MVSNFIFLRTFLGRVYPMEIFLSFRKEPSSTTLEEYTNMSFALIAGTSLFGFLTES